MIAIEKDDEQLTLRFSAGRGVTILGIVLPLVALGGLALLVFLPRTAMLTCTRTSGRCTIVESSHVKAKTTAELAVADLHGAHVDRTKDGTSLVLETTSGKRALALGRRFDHPEVAQQHADGAEAIKRFVADPSIDRLEVKVPRRHGENAIWGGILTCAMLGSVVCFIAGAARSRSRAPMLRGCPRAGSVRGAASGRWPTFAA